MRSITVGVLLAAAALAAPGSALAAVEIGSESLSSSADVTLGCTSGPCIQTQEQTDGDFNVNVVPSGGRIITGFKVRYATGNFALTVLRQSGATTTRVAGTTFVPGSGTDTVQAFDTHIAVQPGDFIGLRLASGASMGAENGGAGTNAYELSDAANPAVIDAAEPYDLQLSATVEADRDNDGLADDSEDPDGGFPQQPKPPPPPPPPPPDPLAELKAGKKPGLAISRSRITVSKNVVSLKVANKKAYRLSGRVKLRRRGKTVGSRRYSLSAGKSGRVRIRLNRATRRVLARRRRIKLGVVASVKGPIGKTGTSKRNVTVVLPRKKKKRKKTSGGSNRFVGRTKNLDVQFSFTLRNGKMNSIRGGILVTCFSLAGNKSGSDLYDPPAPFAIGKKVEQTAANKPSGVSGTKGSKRYTMDARRRSANRITGTIGIGYTFPTFNPFTGNLQSSSCVGQDDFTATRR